MVDYAAPGGAGFGFGSVYKPVPTPSPIQQGAGAAPVVNPQLGAVVPDLAGRAAAIRADPTASPFNQWWANRQAPAQPQQGPPGPPPSATLDDVDAATARTPNYQRIVNFFSRTDPNQLPQAQQDQMSDFYQRPDVRQQIASTPGLADQVLKDKFGTMAQLQPMVDAAQQNLPGMANGKPVADRAGVQQRAISAGVPYEQAHAFHEVHNYSEEEFKQATKGMTWGQAMKLWGFQHYLPPQQQIMVDALAGKSQDVDKAQAMLQQLQTNNAPQAMIDDAQAKLAAAHKGFNDLSMRFAAPQTYALPNMQGYE